MTRITPLFFLIAIVCCGCGSDGPQAPGLPETGIVGQVYRSPTEPVCVVSDPCEETFAATFHVYRDDVKVAEFKTGDDGRFRLEIDPGEYLIVPDASAPILFPEGQAKAVTVPKGTVVTVRLDFDTGIV